MKNRISLICTFSLMVLFTNHAVAYEWNLFGSARMATFYIQDFNPSLTPLGLTETDQLQWRFQPNSRIGAKVSGDKFDGRAEVGANVPNASLRFLYGSWKFYNDWKLKIGKDNTPIKFSLSNQVINNDQNLQQIGAAWGGRSGQIAIEGQGFKFAAITPVTRVGISPTSNVRSVDVQVYWPKFEASYIYHFDDTKSVHIIGGIEDSFFTAVLNDGTTRKGSITALVFGAGGTVGIDPGYLNAQVSWYRDGAAAGWLGSALQGDATVTVTPVIGRNGRPQNVDSIMAMLAVGYVPTERVRFETGIGYLRNKSKGENKSSNEYYAVYLQSLVTLAPGVFLVPEIGYIDFGEVTGTGPERGLGELWYLGAKWQIDF